MEVKQLRVIIIDDEKRIRSSIKNILKLHYPNAEVVAEAEDIVSAEEAIRDNKPDVVLLDIKMPGGTGIDLVKNISLINFKIIFITAFDSYAIQAIKLSALDYLLKPVIPDELVSALNKACEQINSEQEKGKLSVLNHNTSGSYKGRKIILKTQSEDHIIEENEIVRCEADRNYTTFILYKKKEIVVSKNLKEYEEMLDPKIFFRPHNSHLVNIHFIEKIQKKGNGILLMKDSSEVPISARKHAEVMDILSRIS
ncbi:MAG: response regulator transcription factor [Bacteroidetes bacterium]|nr:response regulator transcription factor [Bacteroidota bacterium]